MSRDRSKPDALYAIRQSLGNFVRRGFPRSPIRAGIFHQVAMQLQHNALSKRHVLVALMNRVQHVPIAGDLRLGAIRGFDLFFDDRPQPLAVRDDPLNARFEDSVL